MSFIKLHKLALVFVLATAAVTVFIGMRSSEGWLQNSNTVESVLELLFEKEMPGTDHWRPQADKISVMRVPPRDMEIVPYVGFAQTEADKLVAEASEIVGLPVVEWTESDPQNARVGLFYPLYENSAESHSVWLKNATEFAGAIMAGSGIDLSALTRVIEPMLSAVLEETEEAAAEAAAQTEEINAYTEHLEERACKIARASYFRTGNTVVSVFAFYGADADQRQLTLCLVKPILAAFGLVDIKPLKLNDVIDYSQGEPRLTPLIVCSLKVLYHPSLDDAGTPGNPAKERARKLLETEEVCA